MAKSAQRIPPEAKAIGVAVKTGLQQDAHVHVWKRWIEAASSKCDHYYKVMWFHPDRGWLTSTMMKRPSLQQAREQFDKDIEYFYDDIIIRAVRVEEYIWDEARGSQKRRK